MSLQTQIDENRRTIRTDGYPISIGELVSMYENGDIDVHPEFQRFFRWSAEKKSRFVESILIGIPIPSVFFYQRPDGILDVVDGTQRLSTIFEFVGVLRGENGALVPPLRLVSGTYLTDLEGKTWVYSDIDSKDSSFTDEQRRLFRREKIDVKFILRESDETAKYELFQRINTGGETLSDQEVRNCLLVMRNPDAFRYIKRLAALPAFQETISLSERLIAEQYDLELVLRFLTLASGSVHVIKRLDDFSSFLTDRMTEYFSANNGLNRDEDLFRWVFETLHSSLEDNAFRKFDVQKDRFVGSFLISAFEAISLGLAQNYQALKGRDLKAGLEQSVKRLWANEDFRSAGGSGISTSSRLPKTLRVGKEYFAQI